MPNRWLVKTEPKAYPYAQLEKDGRTVWDGVGNALARIHMRAMAEGDLVLVYHSGAEKAVVGLAKVAAGPRPDPLAAADPKSVVIDLVPVAPAKTPAPLAWIKAEPACADLGLVRLPRLSVMPVPASAFTALTQKAGLPSRG